RSDTFVAVDTEAINPEMLAQVQDLVDANGGSALDAVVSTDGDSDRPLVLGVAEGKVRFFPGDILGIVTADYVGARDIAVPISVNDAVDAHFAARGITPVKTRIGSPYVIQAMRQVGWEANGGFLTATPVSMPGGGTLQALPTRDAFLPILSALCASLGKGLSLPELFSRLPPRFGKSGLLRDFPRDRADAIVKRFSPADTSVMEARWNPAGTSLSIRRTDGTRENAGEADPVFQVLGELRERVSRFFGHERHFSSIAWMSWLDGVRIGFDNGDIAHVRPSGNAPELRVYANSGSSQRADEIVTLATEPGGILQQLAAIQGFRLSPRILALRCPVQHYAWGGYSFIPSLLGEQDSGHAPWAELWIGAHPLAPSEAILDGCRVRLDRLIQEVPEEILGAGDAGRFSARLPFLMKVLDARAMLSIQAHPTKEQAAEGFARENRAGVPLDAPGRLYRDDNHKPEAHVALTEFWMLHGFRPLEEISALLGSVPELGKAMPGFPARLVAAGADRSARENLLRELYTGVMTMPQARVDQVLAPLLDRLSAQERGGALAKDAPDFWALRASREMPLPGGQIDRGIFSIYLLNLLHLHPGEGTYQPAGTLHAYLEGTNVEVMANSDNVLRGGLTPKSVDTGELLKILSYVDGRPPVLKGKEEGNGSRVYETPAQEFVLDRLEPAAGASLHGMRDRGAECLIALEGSALLVSGGTELKLGKGAVALAPAGVPYEMRFPAPGTLVFRARVP
ncbi:MAG TPA: mannose-6-phosphate isomerase, class I, partial [Spirochaetia bacterium]|nr:mannose-6-phosphate isomerase, class I [Spirochaetia bacterium]